PSSPAPAPGRAPPAQTSAPSRSGTRDHPPPPPPPAARASRSTRSALPFHAPAKRTRDPPTTHASDPSASGAPSNVLDRSSSRLWRASPAARGPRAESPQYRLVRTVLTKPEIPLKQKVR